MSVGIKVLSTVTVGTSAVTAGGAVDCALIIFATPTGNANTVYIGDSTVTNTKFSVALTNGQNYTYVAYQATKPGFSQLNLNKFYVYGGAAGQLINISYLERGT